MKCAVQTQASMTAVALLRSSRFCLEPQMTSILIQRMRSFRYSEKLNITGGSIFTANNTTSWHLARPLGQLDGMLIDNSNYDFQEKTVQICMIFCAFSSFKPKEFSRGVRLFIMLIDVLP